MNSKSLFISLSLLGCLAFGQVTTDSLVIVNDKKIEVTAPFVLKEKNPIKASLYSAFLPGAGQIYNERWWKAPIALGLVGTGVGFTGYYNGLYKKYRKAYLAKREGKPNDYDNLSAEQLGVYQDEQKRNRDYMVAITALVYILNILDATVDAHLFSTRNDPDMTFSPIIIQDYNTMQPTLGLSFNLKF